MGAFEEDFWIGVQAKLEFEECIQAAIPSNYEFLDGTDASFFDVRRGDFPWRVDHPWEGRNRCCVATNPSTVTVDINQLRWKNEICSENLGYICRRPCDVIKEADQIMTARVFGVAFAILGLAMAMLIVALLKTISIKRRLDIFYN